MGGGGGGGGGEGTPLYKLHLIYRYVPPHRRFGLKRVYALPILVCNRFWFSRELRECMNVFIVSIPKENYANSKWT